MNRLLDIPPVFEFLKILRDIHIAIAYMKSLNDEALKHLPGPS